MLLINNKNNSYNYSYIFHDYLSVLERGDPNEVMTLLEILLGIAVQSSNKETYITGIMSLDGELKADLMTSIQQTLSIIQAANQRGSHIGIIFVFF